MARTFAYCRVSTLGQTVENQIREIEAAGFRVEKRRLATETVSGNSAIEQRPGFMKLLDRLERDDVLGARQRRGKALWPQACAGWRATAEGAAEASGWRIGRPERQRHPASASVGGRPIQPDQPA
jgi:Resolvase, N terminal domain